MKQVSPGKFAADATIADVARHADVSIRTVSRVLNRSPKVNARTREHVEATIAALGFQPSARARGLATGRSFLIGFVHNDRNAMVLDPVQRGIVAAAAVRGYELVVHPTPTRAPQSLNDVMSFVRRSQIDGLVVLPPVWSIEGLAAALKDARVPAIAISSVPVPDFPATLLSDERRAAGAVAQHLLDLGHRDIAMISGPADAYSAKERRAGFTDVLARAGRGLAGEAEGDYGFDSGVVAAERLMALTPRPSAIFAANDFMAAGVLKAAHMHGIVVPDELSVVGFDGGILSRMMTPALTTVERPLRAMAQRATACLLDLIEAVPTETALHAELTLSVRESSGRAP